MFWYAVNASIDGIDPWSESLTERAKFAVYQQRLYQDALKTQAWMTAAASPEKAGQALKAYLDTALPPDPRQAMLQKFRDEQRAAAVAKLGPIDPSTIRFGSPLENLPQGGSMARPSDLAHLLASSKPKGSASSMATGIDDLRVPKKATAEDVMKLGPVLKPSPKQ